MEASANSSRIDVDNGVLQQLHGGLLAQLASGYDTTPET